MYLLPFIKTNVTNVCNLSCWERRGIINICLSFSLKINFTIFWIDLCSAGGFLIHKIRSIQVYILAKSISLVSLSKDIEDKENSMIVQFVMVLSQIHHLNTRLVIKNMYFYSRRSSKELKHIARKGGKKESKCTLFRTVQKCTTTAAVG